MNIRMVNNPMIVNTSGSLIEISKVSIMHNRIVFDDFNSH